MEPETTPPDRYANPQDRIAELEGQLSRMSEATNYLIGYALTSRSQKPEWLEGLAKAINKAADSLGDKDLAVVWEDGLYVKKDAYQPRNRKESK
ncbi:MAG: hypothetical protein P4L85_14240 [Paludisphaera borealis]|uniref:hypothetical protein n=1 Tax=Paludisphaera borealis TaxID=1387353 RepID=UPI00284A4C20|nr:hypothetical protein [Paludisphaera borealis]MDR3620506.1 hypothetical protein [Paludisphaera borealis]